MASSQADTTSVDESRNSGAETVDPIVCACTNLTLSQLTRFIAEGEEQQLRKPPGSDRCRPDMHGLPARSRISLQRNTRIDAERRTPCRGRGDPGNRPSEPKTATLVLARPPFSPRFLARQAVLARRFGGRDRNPRLRRQSSSPVQRSCRAPPSGASRILGRGRRPRARPEIARRAGPRISPAP